MYFVSKALLEKMVSFFWRQVNKGPAVPLTDPEAGLRPLRHADPLDTGASIGEGRRLRNPTSGQGRPRNDA